MAKKQAANARKKSASSSPKRTPAARKAQSKTGARKTRKRKPAKAKKPAAPKRKPAKRNAATSPARRAKKKAAGGTKSAARKKSVQKSRKRLGRSKVAVDAKLDVLFQRDYQAREVFAFLRVETVRELVAHTPDEIIERMTRPLVQTVSRIRKALALSNRSLAGDEPFALEFLEQLSSGR